MAKEKKAAKTAPADTGATDEAAPAAPKRSKLKVFAIGGAALTLCLCGGGYFAVPMALAMFAPAAEASTQEASTAGGGHGGQTAGGSADAPMPVAKLVTPDRAASDYQIVSIYEGEAFLATNDTIIRIKVGSTAPGLGDILAIEPSESGGTIEGTLATLKTS